MSKKERSYLKLVKPKKTLSYDDLKYPILVGIVYQMTKLIDHHDFTFGQEFNDMWNLREGLGENYYKFAPYVCALDNKTGVVYSFPLKHLLPNLKEKE